MANFYYLDGYFYLEKIVKNVLMNVILYQIYFKVYIDQLFRQHQQIYYLSYFHTGLYEK